MRGEELYCRSIALDGLFEFVRKKGGNPLLLAAEVGLDPAFQTKAIDFVPWNTICDYLELCADRLDAPSFGIEWAYALPEDSRNSGPLLLVGTLKKNLRDAFDLIVTYQKIHTNGVAYSYKEYPNAGELTGYIDIHPLSHPSRQFCEHIMAGIVILANRYVPDTQFTHMTLQHSPPIDPIWHDSAFPFKKTYNADHNTLTTQLSVFETPTSHLTPVLLPLLRSYLNRRQKTVSARTSIALDISELLPNILGLRRSKISDVAEAMGVSEKKLQRLLREEGTTYSAVLDDVRKTSATRLLLESDISITRLAHMLDYASIESFNTACHRWHGQSPRQVRIEGRGVLITETDP